ncbi:hypothetical protein [Pseudogemmobacter bohemicus]|uniref:hypothetical protein n=1 Tax=Pseudogemmobacter bohemicus TaxID=2250708 RepID=UPI000DD3B78F|nr:hypothetical protein [Pseudogemmobacter bohemicus]
MRHDRHLGHQKGHLGWRGLGQRGVFSPLPFHPSDLFAAGQPGHWPGGYDPTQARLWQTATGVVARVAAAGQQVAIVPDRSQGGALGPELSAAEYTISTANQPVHTAAVEGLYRFDMEIVSGDGRARQQGTMPSIAHTLSFAPALLEADVIARPGSLLRINTNAATGLVCRPTLRLIAGNHASQEVAVARPTLSQSGGKWCLETDGGDSLSITLPAGTYGRAWVSAAGVVTVDTVTNPTNALIPTAVGATQADVILRQGAFTSTEEAQIRAYWGGLYA